jgi:hypothetical protein
MEVNYSALDDLVLDYLETEGLLQVRMPLVLQAQGPE